MKSLRTILILIVLFVLPAGSWYFLKYGFNWRKGKLAALETKGHFISDLNWNSIEKENINNSFSSRTTVVKFADGLSVNDEKIIDQFKKVNGFQWVLISKDSSSFINVPSNDPRKYIVSPRFYSSPNSYRSLGHYMLVDTGLNIRQIYEGDSEKMLRKLVEDITIVIPKKKQKDISIRKKNND